MVPNLLFKPLSVAFATVIFIESFIWTALSFTAILCYLDILKYDTSEIYGLKKFATNFYDLYLSEKPLWIDARFVSPDIFFTLMWIYFIFSLLLSIISGVHISVLIQKSKPRKVNFSTIVWLSAVFVICLCDIITCIFFGIDYYLTKKKIHQNDTAETELVIAVIFTILTLAAKGFALWIFNFVFAIILSILFKQKIYSNEEPILRPFNEVEAQNYVTYNAYGDITLVENKPIDGILTNVSKNQKHTETTPALTNDISWHAKLSREDSRRNYSTIAVDKISYIEPHDEISISSFCPHIPRASSFRQPRSLGASVCPSPIPPPSKESPITGRKSAPPEYAIPYIQTFGATTSKDGTNILDQIHTGDGSFCSSGYRTEYEYYDDDDEDVIQSVSKMKRVYPKRRRFNLDEPEPDYEYK